MKTLLGKKIKSKELKIISRQLSSMLKSGCDIVTCLEIITVSSSKTVQDAFKRTASYIKKGKTLAESFALSTYFSNFFVSMVHAGEMSGRIDYVFSRMASYYERENKLKSKILGACLYPIILMIVSIFSFMFMLVFVVPNFEKAFESYEGIDTNDIFIFKISMFLRNNYIFLTLILILGFLFMFKSLHDNDEIKRKIDRAVFNIPKLKKLNQLYICDQFSRSLSILISSGINIEDSIDIASNTIGSSYFQIKIKIAKSYIESGSNISKSLSKTGIFPQVFISMMLAGEESGSFDDSLVSISNYYEEELDIELENLTKLIEPIMLLIMGVAIGSVLISILSPMFEMVSSIS